MFATATRLGRAHDAFPSAGDDHVAGFLHQLTETMGGFVGGGVGLGARRAENRNFFDPAIRGENLVGVLDFPHDPLELLQISEVCSVRIQFKNGGNHLLKELPLLLDSSGIHKLINVVHQRINRAFRFLDDRVRFHI